LFFLFSKLLLSEASKVPKTWLFPILDGDFTLMPKCWHWGRQQRDQMRLWKKLPKI
jgi:hypothetical protein